jgi:hypothetical protein
MSAAFSAAQASALAAASGAPRPTLFVVPVVFVWVERIRRSPRQLLRGRGRRPVAPVPEEPTPGPGIAAREAESRTG